MKFIALSCWVSLVALHAVGCATDVGDAPTTPPDGTTDLEEMPRDPDPLALIEDETGSVSWYPPANPGDTLEVVIRFRGTAAPILHPDFVDKVGAIKAYMAAAEPGTELPASLRPYASDAELRLDTASLESLREEARSIREAITQENANVEGFSTLSGGCTAAQQTAAKNSYGAAYSAGGGSSGSKTCGNDMAFHNATGTVYYCNFGACDQDYTLALGQCAGVVDDDCTTVGGDTTARRARMRVYPNGDPTWQNYGLRYRFGYYNCSDTYTAVMRRKRGGGDWIYTDIDPGGMQIRVGGGAYPPDYALAHTFGLGGSVWQEDHDWDHDTAQSPLNSMNIVAPTDGFMCGDIIQRFVTYDASAGSCNGFKRLCDDGTCTGTGLCFD
jgi:hypothetical protein